MRSVTVRWYVRVVYGVWVYTGYVHGHVHVSTPLLPFTVLRTDL